MFNESDKIPECLIFQDRENISRKMRITSNLQRREQLIAFEANTVLTRTEGRRSR